MINYLNFFVVIAPKYSKNWILYWIGNFLFCLISPPSAWSMPLRFRNWRQGQQVHFIFLLFTHSTSYFPLFLSPFDRQQEQSCCRNWGNLVSCTKVKLILAGVLRQKFFSRPVLAWICFGQIDAASLFSLLAWPPFLLARETAKSNLETGKYWSEPVIFPGQNTGQNCEAQRCTLENYIFSLTGICGEDYRFFISIWRSC